MSLKGSRYRTDGHFFLAPGESAEQNTKHYIPRIRRDETTTVYNSTGEKVQTVVLGPLEMDVLEALKKREAFFSLFRVAKTAESNPCRECK